MQLRFFARAGFFEPDPRFSREHGQPCRRIARELDGSASPEPAVFDSESPAGRRVLKVITRESSIARRAETAPLYPADRETAAACGLPFVPVEPGPGGEFVPVPPPPQPRRKADQ